MGNYWDIGQWMTVPIAAAAMGLFAAASLYIPIMLLQAISERIRSRAGKWLMSVLVMVVTLTVSMLAGAALGVGVLAMIFVIGGAQNDKHLTSRRLLLLSLAFGVIVVVFALGRIEDWVFQLRQGGPVRAVLEAGSP